MIPELRRRFNENFTPERYRRFLDILEAGCGTPIQFRNAETPCFFPEADLAELATAGQEMIGQLLGNREYLAAAEAMIPPEFRVPSRHVPGEDDHPLFFQADFGMASDGRPRLVEIQGFPSLYAYQPFLAEAYQEAYDLDPELRYLLGGLSRADYDALLRRAIVGDHDPENVVLLEIEPWKQKTLPDFLLTERMCGISTVDITDLRKQGNRLFYPRDGRLVPVARIYNRAIADEMIRTGVRPAFDFRDDLDVEWAGHPNWYFQISKFSLPYLKHPTVPQTQFLDRVETLPEDLENWVLKPLFSFAGLGVRIGPTKDEITAIPTSERRQYILQERVDFQPTIATPLGLTKVEIRILFVWIDGEKPRAVTSLLRMGRGKMMGVDHNRDLDWVGASVAFMPPQ